MLNSATGLAAPSLPLARGSTWGCELPFTLLTYLRYIKRNCTFTRKSLVIHNTLTYPYRTLQRCALVTFRGRPQGESKIAGNCALTITFTVIPTFPPVSGHFTSLEVEHHMHVRNAALVHLLEEEAVGRVRVRVVRLRACRRWSPPRCARRGCAGTRFCERLWRRAASNRQRLRSTGLGTS